VAWRVRLSRAVTRTAWRARISSSFGSSRCLVVFPSAGVRSMAQVGLRRSCQSRRRFSTACAGLSPRSRCGWILGSGSWPRRPALARHLRQRHGRPSPSRPGSGGQWSSIGGRAALRRPPLR
jgi:hypothetical protein